MSPESYANTLLSSSLLKSTENRPITWIFWGGLCCDQLLQLCPTVCSLKQSPTRLLCPWDSPGKNTGVGCCALLQGIFPIQRSNPCLLSLLPWQVNSLLLSHREALRGALLKVILTALSTGPTNLTWEDWDIWVVLIFVREPKFYISVKFILGWTLR